MGMGWEGWVCCGNGEYGVVRVGVVCYGGQHGVVLGVVVGIWVAHVLNL